MISGFFWSASMCWTKYLAAWVVMLLDLDYIQSLRNPTLPIMKSFCARVNLCGEINALYNSTQNASSGRIHAAAN